jgi:hypothetical protein
VYKTFIAVPQARIYEISGREPIFSFKTAAAADMWSEVIALVIGNKKCQ